MALKGSADMAAFATDRSGSCSGKQSTTPDLAGNGVSWSTDKVLAESSSVVWWPPWSRRPPSGEASTTDPGISP